MDFIEANFSNRSFEEIVRDDMMQRSLIRSLEVIGEASKNLSTKVRERYPDVPWSGMARMRDRRGRSGACRREDVRARLPDKPIMVGIWRFCHVLSATGVAGEQPH